MSLICAEGASSIDPPYEDVFLKTVTNDGDKMCLLTSKWETVQKFNFPTRYINGKFRKIQSQWFVDNIWLRYSKSTGGVYCGPCHLFGFEKRSLVSQPVTDPSNGGKVINAHNKWKNHVNSLEAAENYISIMSGKKKDIAQSISSAYDDIVVKNRKILSSIIEAILLCGRQNLALRGHEDKDSNFIALLEYQAKYNPVLKDHLDNGDPRTKYTSPEIQNELISICGDQIREEIVKKCNEAPFFGFMADEATDASTMEQMALCLRYYDGSTRSVREDFITFAECEATTGESLSRAFLEKLQQAGVHIEKMRGQGYDGAANMSGKFRGVQARIRQIIPNAVYTHCKAHCLNLAIVHASEEPLVRNVNSTVQEVAFLFNYSGKRLLRFQETLANDQESKSQMEKRTKLQSLCETRWAARADAFNTFKCSYSTVVDSLEDLSINYGDGKAGAYKIAITQFGFVIGLVTVEHVLSGLVQLSLMLQNKACDLVEAVKEARTVVRQVDSERNDEAVWDALYNKSVDMATSVGVEPSRPRANNNQRQQHRQNVPAANVSEYWRRNLYLPFVDHLIAELSDRLIEDGERFHAQYLIPSEINHLTNEIEESLFATFAGDLPATSLEEFQREISRWKARCANTDPVHQTIGDTLANINTELYSNVATCLHILLAMPVSTATAERSFSAMRRVKTYLRSTMTTDRLSGLGLLSIHKEREINVDLVIDTFARKRERRLAFLFRV